MLHSSPWRSRGRHIGDDVADDVGGAPPSPMHENLDLDVGWCLASADNLKGGGNNAFIS